MSQPRIKRFMPRAIRRARHMIDTRRIQALCVVVDSAGRPLACCATRDAAIRWLKTPEAKARHADVAAGATELIDFGITV